MQQSSEHRVGELTVGLACTLQARPAFGSQYASHVEGRQQGRDLQSGFRTPHGVDYISVGGTVAVHSGRDIQKVINPDFNPKIKLPDKIQVPPPHLSLVATYVVALWAACRLACLGIVFSKILS
jgi:hypothetical protein